MKISTQLNLIRRTIKSFHRPPGSCLLWCLIATFLGLTPHHPAFAGQITSPTDVINNTMGEFSASFLDAFMIDQSGLSSGFTSGITDFSTYLSATPTHGFNQTNVGWGSTFGVTSGILDFDLGTTLNISSLVIWPDDFHAPNNIEILTSSDSSFSTATIVASINVANPTNVLPIDPQIFSLTPTSARFIRFNVNSSHGLLVAIGEVAFDTVVSDPIEIALDIKPGPSNNTVALNGNGTLQMAILANVDFDVLDIDIDSLLFGDPILVDGGATALGATSDRLRDLNHDGLDDLLVGFSISDLVDGGALDASSVEGRLTGELFDGTPIFGSDIVRMVPQNNSGGSLVISTVPEPTTSALALAALCLAMSRRRSF